jgi:mRNA-degrading endonuclease toxin of MazEF toxin-antitoxin module
VKLWVNIWCEENGKWWFIRPVLVVKKIWALYFCVPLTSKIKKHNRWYYQLENEVQRWKVSTLLLTQWRVIDKKRFFKHIWYIQNDEFIKIKNLLQTLYL